MGPQCVAAAQDAGASSALHRALDVARERAGPADPSARLLAPGNRASQSGGRTAPHSSRQLLNAVNVYFADRFAAPVPPCELDVNFDSEANNNSTCVDVTTTRSFRVTKKSHNTPSK